MRLIKFGMITLLIVIASSVVCGSVFKTTYNPFTGKLDYYMSYNSSDFGVTENITNNITNLLYLGSKNCTGTDKLVNITINQSGVFGDCGADLTSGFVYADYFNQYLNTSSNVVFNTLNLTNPTWLNITDQRYNESARVDVVNMTAVNANTNATLMMGYNSTLARTGTCSAGTVVQNTTNGGVQCVTVSGSTDGNNYTTSIYFTGNNTGIITLNLSRFGLTDLLASFNISVFNDTALANTKLDSTSVLNWSNLDEYPMACPANTYVTQVADSITCMSTNFSGYNTTTQLNTLYYSINNPYGFFNQSNATQIRDIINNSGTYNISIPLDMVANPNANKQFTMDNKNLSFTWTAPTEIGLEIEALGGFTGDLVHIYQHTGNPGADTDLLHLESVDADVLGLNVTCAKSTCVVINTNISASWIDANINASKVQNAPWLSSVPYQSSAAGWVNTSINTTFLGLIITNRSGEMELYYPTGNLTIRDASDIFVRFTQADEMVVSGNGINMTSKNISSTGCIKFSTGGMICGST